MGLFKRGSVWWMRFTYQGKQIKESTETDDKKLAQRIYDKVKGEVAEGKWFEKLPGEDRTFKEMMERYMTEHSARNKAPKSHRRDKSLRDHLVGHFGDLTLAEITPSHISDYKNKRRAKGAAPQTVNNELSLMSHAFSLAIRDWEWVKENPVKKVSKEKVNNLIERWLELEEQKNLLASSPKWLQEIITFAINTGLRQSEILDLKWPRVDLSRKTITILEEQKNQGRDTLPLNEGALEVLRERVKVRRGETEYVFTREMRQGSPPLIFTRHSIPLLRRLGLKNSASMIYGTLLPQDSFKQESIYTRFRSSDGGRPSPWLCDMLTIILRVCGLE